MNDRDDVSEKLIRFDDLTERCLGQSFNICLPPAFVQKGTPDGPGRIIIKEKELKRKREEGTRVKNNDQVEDFKMKPNESWKKDFVGQLCGDKPFWDSSKCSREDVKMCTRYHIRGDCFEDCYSRESHKPQKLIPNDRKEAMKTYIKKVRKAN